VAGSNAAGSSAGERISSAVESVPAFNNHLHFGHALETLDWYFPHEVVARTNEYSRGLVEVLTKLLDLPSGPISPETAKEVPERYGRLLADRTATDFHHVLSDLVNVSHNVFIARPGDGEIATLSSERLKTAVHIDQYLFPLDNSHSKALHPWNKVMLEMAEHELAVAEHRLGPRPAELDGYLEFIRRDLETWKDTPNVIGGKWGFSYHRTFDIEPVDDALATRIYESRDSSPAAYKKLQDYLAYEVLRVCAELDFPLQIHTGLGACPGLVLADSEPARLDGLLSRPELEGARVVCLHGGYPFGSQLAVMCKRPNVWMDFSWMVLLLRPRTLAGYLKEWIELGIGDKLIFGVDGAALALPVGTWTARKALAMALAELVEEQTLSEDEAIRLAQAILRDNATAFYKLHA